MDNSPFIKDCSDRKWGRCRLFVEVHTDLADSDSDDALRYVEIAEPGRGY